MDDELLLLLLGIDKSQRKMNKKGEKGLPSYINDRIKTFIGTNVLRKFK